MEAELVGKFGSGHSVGKILLVGEDKKIGVLKLLFSEHLKKLLTGLVDTLLIVGIDDEDETLSVLVVVSPEVTNLES